MTTEPRKWSHSSKETSRGGQPLSDVDDSPHHFKRTFERPPKLGYLRGNSCSPRLSFDEEMTLRRHPVEISRLVQTDSVTNRWARQPRRTLPRMPVSGESDGKFGRKEADDSRQRSHSTPRGNWNLVKNSIDQLVPPKDKRKGILKAESLSESQTSSGRHTASVLDTKWKSSQLQ